MKRKYEGTTRDKYGNVLADATVAVYLSDTSGAANIYLDADSDVAVTGTTSDTYGRYKFFVSTWDYDQDQTFKILISKTDYTTLTIDNITIEDVVEQAFAVSADKTVSTQVYVPKGTTITVAAAKTLTFSGQFSAGRYTIFDGAGTVTFTGNVDEIYPEWWGATGDGTTDDATALQAALTASNGRHCKLAPKTYASSTTLTYPGDDTVLSGVRGATKLLFTAATDGITIPDLYATAGVAIDHVILEDLEIQTSKSTGGKAIMCDFTDYGSGHHIIRNVTATVSGSGKWEYGLYGINFQVSDIYSLVLFQSFTTGIYLGDDCNALRFYGVDIDAGVVGLATSRGIDIANTASSADSQWFGGCLQGYFADSCIRINPGASRMYGFHIENTNTTPADGADIVLASDTTTQKASFTGFQGGSYISVAQAYKIVIADCETDAITWSATSQDNTVKDCKVSGTYTDNGYRDKRLGCVDSSGEGLADLLGQHVAFGADDATPSVAKGNIFHTYNGNNTTITDFDDGAEGQRIIVYIADAKTTVDFSGTNLYGNAGVDWSPTTKDWLEAVYYDGKWYCAVHDCTA